MNAVTDFVKALGPSRIAAMGAVAVGLIGFFIFLAFRFSQPQMGVLYSDLAFEDSTQVVKRLEGLNIQHQLRQDGAIVLVPKEDVLRIRMQLAEEGLPAGGAVGYEIFDKGDTLGATSFVQNINQLRAIEGELSRTIRSLRQVQTARVHLVLPQRKLFSRKKAEPSASIVVKVRGTLDGGQIKAIRHLVASAVEDLNPGNVSIVDERGQLLASGRDGQDTITVEAAEDKNRAFELRMQQQIQNMLTSIVGREHARVQVTAELDYKQTTQKSEIFDPEGQVVRSTETRNETSNSQGGADGAVTVGNELPSADQNNNAGGGSTENSNKSHELINYAVSNTQKTEIVAAGQIKRISVAVLVDGIYTKGKDGKVTYAPRSEDELGEIGKLVRSAIGFDKERGDLVHVSNLRFADAEAPPELAAAEEGMFELSKDDYFYIAELAITLIVALFVLLFVVRPLVRRILSPDEDDGAELLIPEQAVRIDPVTGETVPVLAGGGSGGTLADNPDVQALLAQGNKTTDMLEVAKASGEIHATAIKEVGGIIAGNPDDAVNVIRDWLDADAA